jgi:hypothetical protein
MPIRIHDIFTNDDELTMQAVVRTRDTLGENRENRHPAFFHLTPCDSRRALKVAEKREEDVHIMFEVKKEMIRTIHDLQR